VVATGNLLRDHLLKKRYQKDMITNAKINENTIIVFRGRDEKGRQVLLLLNSEAAQKGKDKDKTLQQVSLRLAYQLSPDKPDVLTIEDGDF
jgi:hypothetical protein